MIKAPVACQQGAFIFIGIVLPDITVLGMCLPEQLPVSGMHMQR